MSAIIALVMTGFAVVGIYKLLTNADLRKSLFGDSAASPIKTTIIFALCACMLLFFWGVFVPALSTSKITNLGTRRELWAVACSASIAGFAMIEFHAWLKRHLAPNRSGFFIGNGIGIRRRRAV